MRKQEMGGGGVTLSYIQAFYSVSHVAMFGILVGTVNSQHWFNVLPFFYFVLGQYQVAALF